MNAIQTKNVLKTMPLDKSVMLVAKHGVGKSSVVKQVAQEMGIEFHDVRLSQCEVGDIKGLPCLDEKNQRTTFLKPYWWPRDPNSSGILFFDELNRATKDVLQAVFEICLDRRLDGEKLPDGWRVVAAINGSEEYDVVELDPALLDRWFYIDFDPSPKEWMNWATKSGVHPAIVDFIAQNENLLDPPVGNLEAGKVYPSRRSWCAFNDTALAMGLFDNTDEGLLTQICKGWLGASISIMFPKFLMHEYSRLKAEDIVNDFHNPNGAIKRKIESACSDIESVGALANSVINELKKRNASSLTPQHKENVKQFFFLLPKDVASQFWLQLLEVSVALKKEIMIWQQDPEVKAFLKAVFLK